MFGGIDDLALLGLEGLTRAIQALVCFLTPVLQDRVSHVHGPTPLRALDIGHYVDNVVHNKQCL